MNCSGCSKSHWRRLNSKSKQQVTLSRNFSSSKTLNSLFFVCIYNLCSGVFLSPLSLWSRTYTNRYDQTHNPAMHTRTTWVTTTNAEYRNSASDERIFIFQATLKLHMIDESGEGPCNEIKIWCFKKHNGNVMSYHTHWTFTTDSQRRKIICAIAKRKTL